MNKNAYEIRLEVLRMAHDDLFGKFHETVGTLRVNAETSGQIFDPKTVEGLYPQTADIISRAEELYSFVS